MNTLRYTIDKIDEISLQNNDTDKTADIKARERGRKLMTDILAVFPKRRRIQTYGPQKPLGFTTPRDTNKVRIYFDPEVSITMYWCLEDIPRKGESINHIDIYISGENKDLLDTKKKSIDTILQEYNKNTENKIKIDYKEYIY